VGTRAKLKVPLPVTRGVTSQSTQVCRLIATTSSLGVPVWEGLLFQVIAVSIQLLPVA
jgi:hypothetical protein